MEKKDKIAMLEQSLDRKLTTLEMYENRPRKWILYLVIVLAVTLLVGWSADDIHFTGLTATGTEVAKGVVHGVFHPDTNLLFGTGDSDVPYLLLQTIAIAVLGTIFGAIIAFVIVVFLLVVLTMVPIGLWVTAFFSGVKVRMSDLIGMRLRRVKPRRIVNPMIKATKAGMGLNIGSVEGHYLAGGNVDAVVDALIAAQRADIELNFEEAAAIDLAGRDVLEAVQVSVNPKVIETPKISAVAQDGIEVLVIAKVTVRANIDRLVGGAGEETIIARVGEGIVTTVGSSRTYKEVLENPDNISRVVLEKGLDSGTAYEILSIDIADVDVARNIGARLQTDQAEADKRIAEAKASERRSMAIAREQEMRAEVEAMRARVVEAQSEVPRALAEALKSGNLSVGGYYELENLKSDTAMREAIAGGDKKKIDEARE